MVEAFRSGQVDVLSHIKPYTTEMVANKGAVVLASNADTWSAQTPNSVMSVLDKTLKDRPQVVEAYLRGLICGADIINKHPDKAVDYLTKGNYYRVAPNVLLSAFKTAPRPVSFTPDLASIQSVVDDLTKLGYLKGKSSATDIFRLDQIRTLEVK
jgi:ABC-type nitrate/sulfonate/bicarbonate transport system substrate-binding protein